LQNEKVIKEVKKLLQKNDSAPTYVFPQYTVPPPNMTAPPPASDSDSEKQPPGPHHFTLYVEKL
jgi:hypothetical protein